MKRERAASPKKKDNRQVRKDYKTPRLTRYGHMKELTASTGPSDTDGLSPRIVC